MLVTVSEHVALTSADQVSLRKESRDRRCAYIHSERCKIKYQVVGRLDSVDHPQTRHENDP
jgi:hypothetical protein